MRSKEELIKLRLPWDELTQEEQDLFNNGFGPSWLSTRARAFITKIAGYFFSEASWGHHDYGYSIGGNETRRLECDLKFYQAMRRDSCKQHLQPPFCLITGIYLLQPCPRLWPVFV